MFEPGDNVLCTVEKIEGTIVFVKVDFNGEEKEGSIVVSEIAPGRIRNLRDYVVPKKKIVCKVLRISPNGNIELSLRRVTPKEKKELLEEYKQEKTYEKILRSILKEKASETIKEISKEERLYNFINESKSDRKKLEKLVGKDNAEKIIELLSLEKIKRIIVKKEFSLKSNKPNGIFLIKNVLGNVNNANINYISAGKYSIKTESNDAKSSDNALKSIISEIEKKAKKLDMEFSIREK